MSTTGSWRLPSAARRLPAEAQNAKPLRAHYPFPRQVIVRRPRQSPIEPLRPEKLLTKLSGFLISWAMPAVS